MKSAYSVKHRHLRRKPVTPSTEAYAEFSAWRQEHLPWMLEPGGPAIFFRLITTPEATATTDLYRNAGASVPKLRKTLNELRRLGLVTVVVDPKDGRRELVAATNLFRRLARCYAQAMVQFLGTGVARGG
jgi:DNA-binding MarR family transcriptional regulator